MDIIAHGDFIINSINGKTTFGFQLPSSHLVPFKSKPYNNHMLVELHKDKFEQPCPCGSGLKYKECHGKGL